jgi:hypothetical protein
VLRARLGRELIGLYLHGSAAFEDYHPDRSDIDLLAVCNTALAAADRPALAASLAAAALPCPAAGGLEFSLITQSAAVAPSTAPGYELHGWDSEGRLRPDDGRGDPDLPLHFAVVRARGVTVVGPPPHDVLREVPRGEILAMLAAQLDWADANASPSYRVLTACRALCFFAEGRICSKREAAEWALERGESAALLTEVMAHHDAATSPIGLDPEIVAAYISTVRVGLRNVRD